MSRVITICRVCNEDMYGKDGAVCRFCHETFCEDCGDLGTRECDSCGDAQEEVVEYVEKTEREGSTPGDEDEPEDDGYGDSRDIKYFGE